MTECNALVYGKNARLNCGGVAETSFHDPIDGMVVYTCKRHAKSYRKNPLTWKERELPQATKED